MVYILFSLFFLFFSSAQINAVEIPEHIFNSKLTQEERVSLAEGKQLIRNINHAKNICLKNDSPVAKEITDTFKKLNPAYLAETIQIIPVTEENRRLSLISYTQVSFPFRIMPEFPTIQSRMKHTMIYILLPKLKASL